MDENTDAVVYHDLQMSLAKNRTDRDYHRMMKKLCHQSNLLVKANRHWRWKGVLYLLTCILIIFAAACWHHDFRLLFVLPLPFLLAGYMCLLSWQGDKFIRVFNDSARQIREKNNSKFSRKI